MREFANNDTKVFYDYWMSLADGAVPHYRAWDPVCVPAQMPWCTIIERGGETGFQLRFAGTAVCAFYEEEITGQPIGKRLDARARAFYFSRLDETLSRPCGAFLLTQARSETGRDCLFETLVLPLADDNGVGVRLLMHRAIIERVAYGDASSKFSIPDRLEWIDLGAGVPADDLVDLAQSN